jgi:glycosyltransferase involved in cell wall biosynthesis
VTRVLLVTSHPVSAPADSADKSIAADLVRLLPGHAFIGFRRLRRPPLADRGRWIPIASLAGRPGWLERAQAAALAVALSRQVDLVHLVTSIGGGYRGLLVLRSLLGSRPLIHTVPGILADGLPDGAVRPPATAPSPLDGDHGITVALSSASAELLRSKGFRDVRVIPPAIDLARWPLLAMAEGPAMSVLFAGHFDPGGGAVTAIDGVGALRERGVDARLILAMRTRLGQDEAPEHEALMARARRADVPVELYGTVDDMRPLLASAHAVVLPATDLGGKADVPLILLEAMASGRPVIVSDLPPVARLGPAVLRIAPGSASELAVALGRLQQDPAEAARLAAAGRAQIEDAFSERAFAQSYADLYRELLTERS